MPKQTQLQTLQRLKARSSKEKDRFKALQQYGQYGWKTGQSMRLTGFVSLRCLHFQRLQPLSSSSPEQQDILFMLNFISFHTPSQNTRVESTLVTPQHSKPDTSLVFNNGPKKDHFQPLNASVYFGAAMPPPGGGGDHFFRQTGHYYEPIPGYDQTQGLFLPDTAPQIPTYTRWRTLPAIRNKPELLPKIESALAEVAAKRKSKNGAADSEGIRHFWMSPPSDQKIAQAEYLLSIGTSQPKVAKETSIFHSWLVGLVATRQTGLNNPKRQEKLRKALEYRDNGDSIRVAAKKAGISHTWLTETPDEKKTKAKQHMREGKPQPEAAKMAGISQHWLAGEGARLKQEAASESEASYSSTGLTDAVSRMELSHGRSRPKISSKMALAYFEREGILDPALDAEQHATVMGHIATYAYSHPAQKEDALNKLSAYSEAYNTRFPAVQHRLRTLGDELSGPAPIPSEVASGSHSSTDSDTSLFSSIDISQISQHLPEVEVLGGTMYAHYDQSGNYMGHFNEPQPRQ